ncbi:unnamed protein product [Orchesella dallaii]|uniref:Ferric-chelate reductase 1 n=2 Tax=Orchesella dallaii TaxID=48710 RepID=A0ABP1S203_9HEXA
MLLRIILLLQLFEFISHAPSHLLVQGHPTIQCAQTGASLLHKKDNRRGWHLRKGSFTIGARRFDSKYGGAMYGAFETSGDIKDLFKRYPKGHEAQKCPYSLFHYSGWELELCDNADEKFKVRIQSVEQRKNGTGELITLHGWLHIEVEVVDTADSIRMIYAQMYDEYFNAIGEFVKDPSEQCPSSNPAEYVSPTEFQYLPCSAIGAREAKASQAVYMVHSDDLIDKSLKGSPFLPPKEMNRFIHFTWRMNEYWCSRHFRITPMIFVLTKKNIDNWRSVTKEGTRYDNTYKSLGRLGDWKMYRKIPNFWLVPDWIGAADIVHPSRGPLHCNNPITIAPWIRNTTNHTVKQEYFHWTNLYDVYEDAKIRIVGSETCQQNPYFITNYAKFVGRCKGHKSKETSSNNLHKCNTDPNTPEFEGLNIRFDKYKEYVNNLTVARNETCNQRCRAPLTDEDAVDISQIPAEYYKPVIHDGYGLTHRTRTKSSLAKFWRGRKFHGMLALIVAFFLIPVSNFSARYYKESFMRCQFKGIHVWFWVHFWTSLASLAILITGQLALVPEVESWGHSTTGIAISHHVFGWISISLFILMVAFGGFRPNKMKWRIVFLKAHSVVGFVIHGLNILVILLSTYIPASPSLRRCDREGLPTDFSVTFWMALCWFGLDVIFHGFLTALQYTADKALNIKRPSYFPILPILDPKSHVDMKRTALRKLLFIVYFVVSVAFLLGSTIHLGVKYQPDGCTIGDMSCKAALGCTSAALTMCKKLGYKYCQ